ncbi:MAG: hypothetical protein QOE70_5706 [Chthoniobacter sp.]|jgi:uncharacterized membrane protein|nr:hypothetical protein [Chthoniobacter sp.]
MSFLHPLMLGGLAAVSVPIIIHLLNKFRVKTTGWGAMRFLLESVRKNERRVKMEDLILLLLRCLLVALAVAAFARPVRQALLSGDDEKGGPEATVVLLDNSASMGQSSGVESRFDLAKAAIRQWAETQGGQSQGALFLVSNRTEPLIGKPAGDWGLFRKTLAEAELSDRGSDLAQGVRLAVEALQGVAGRTRAIRIYTDGQAGAWSHQEELRKLARENPEIRIEPVLAGNKVEENLGLVSLRAEGGVIAARQPCRFMVEVGNYGTAPIEGVKVVLSIDDGTPAGDALIARLEPGSTQAASVMISFPTAGPQAVTASLPPDALAADNRRTAAFDVVAQMNVLLTEENPAATAPERDSFYLGHALVPLSRETASRHYLATLAIPPADLPAELGNANNTATQAVFLCQPGAIAPVVTQALRKYVQGGGNLIIFPGPATDPAEWKANAPLWEMLPAELAPATEETAGESPLTWQASDFTHPITALWNDSAQGSLGAVKVARHFPLTPKANGARVVVALSNGEPAVVEWAFGEGRVVLFNSTATPAWNNFPLHPAFVPFLQRMMGYLNRQNEQRLALAPGEPFRKRVADELKGKDFSVQRPGAEASRTAGQVVADDRQTFLRYAGTEKAGAYRINIGGEPVATFAVQMDPAESDLRAVTPETLEEIRNVPRGETQKAAAAARLVVTREFWTPLLWIVAIIFIAEALLAHRISHARHA